MAVINAADYPSVQEAVNAARPWDTVSVPSGHHLCPDGLKLKSNLTLRLESGSVLLAPEGIGHYLRGEGLKRETALDRTFIGGFGIENVTVEGSGTVDAAGHTFWTDYDGKPSPADTELNYWVYTPVPERPCVMMFVNCRNVILRDFTILDAPAYTIWAIGCDTMRYERITIRNHRNGPNTDGLDIDCCRNVWVTDCDINAGDDAIALKSDTAILGREMPCERIHIRNCTLTSTCCAVRFGYEGDGLIRDVIISDTLIHDTNKGFDMISVVPERERFEIRSGTRIENVLFKGAVMRNVRHALSVWSGTDCPEDVPDYRGWIRNIRFTEMEIDAFDSSFMGGISVRGITLSHIRMSVRRDRRLYAGQTPVIMTDVWGHGYLPEPLVLHNVPSPVLDDVRIDFEEIGR